MAKPEIYVSIDIEADGPIPGINSMVNIGLAAFRGVMPGEAAPEHPQPIATFEANIKCLPEATPDPDTMAWWAKNPAAWEYVQGRAEGSPTPVSASEAMNNVLSWTEQLPGKPVMVVFPTYDFMFVRWYLVRFCGVERARIFGIQALDLKTLAMAAMNHPTFKGVFKRSMSKWGRALFKGQPPHDHTGLADAIGQGMLFVRLMDHIRRMDPNDDDPRGHM